jgi:hypothetical protein
MTRYPAIQGFVQQDKYDRGNLPLSPLRRIPRVPYLSLLEGTPFFNPKMCRPQSLVVTAPLFDAGPGWRTRSRAPPQAWTWAS